MLTPKQLARQLNVSVETILLWVEREGLPGHRLTRKTIRFDPSKVSAWLTARRERAEVAQRLRVQPGTAREWISKTGISNARSEERERIASIRREFTDREFRLRALICGWSLERAREEFTKRGV